MGMVMEIFDFLLFLGKWFVCYGLKFNQVIRKLFLNFEKEEVILDEKVFQLGGVLKVFWFLKLGEVREKVFSIVVFGVG